jgi:phosphomannomutase
MSAFKAYDIRGVYGTDFDAETVYRIGRCLPELLGARRVLVGRDVRLSSSAVRDALVRGLTEAGCAVDDLGLCTTPMVYYFTAIDGYDASVQITASHNPAAYNGLKISRREAVPVGYDTGLAELERRTFRRRPRRPARAAGSTAPPRFSPSCAPGCPTFRGCASRSTAPTAWPPWWSTSCSAPERSI